MKKIECEGNWCPIFPIKPLSSRMGGGTVSQQTINGVLCQRIDTWHYEEEDKPLDDATLKLLEGLRKTPPVKVSIEDLIKAEGDSL